MTRDSWILSDSFKPALLGLLGLLSLLAAPLAMSDHLPPGIKVIFVRPPAYADKYPGKDTVYTDDDIAQAEELAKLGDAEAQANLGVMLQSRGKFTEAADWYKRAASMGISAAAYNLGTLYYNGQGFPQDYAQALKWFQLAAKRNDPYAQFQLGMMYDMGRGVETNTDEEMRWYTKAAKQGLPAAQYNLAVMYHNGEGAGVDDVQAYAWLLVAARGGVDISEAKPVILENLSADQVHQAEALSRTLYVANPAVGHEN